jgi:ribosome-binding ATPase YchF (GTP1/OBG family)
VELPSGVAQADVAGLTEGAQAGPGMLGRIHQWEW